MAHHKASLAAEDSESKNQLFMEAAGLALAVVGTAELCLKYRTHRNYSSITETEVNLGTVQDCATSIALFGTQRQDSQNGCLSLTVGG